LQRLLTENPDSCDSQYKAIQRRTLHDLLSNLSPQQIQENMETFKNSRSLIFEGLFPVETAN
jgi:translation elongation factor EF-4